MPWQAQLDLDYRFENGRTLLHHQHKGPLRILKNLYPEGDAICHNVVVHPPGGLVGGDQLGITVRVGAHAHALLSTPGATRFYASDAAAAVQQVRIRLAAGARLEWLPLEAIAHPGCRAHNQMSATLDSSAEMMGWDVTALGLPASAQPFEQGYFQQRIELPGLWLEQARIDATDTRLLNSPIGLGGRRCLGSLWLASGSAFTRERREQLLEVVRGVLEQPHEGSSLAVDAGATCPHPQVLVVRAVAPVVEPLMALFQQVWTALRPAAWGLTPVQPRIWRV